MPEVVALLLQNFALLVAMMVTLWAISIALSDVTFIDSFWALGFVLVAISTHATTPTSGIHKDVILLVIGNKTYEALDNISGRLLLRIDLKDKINSILRTGRIKSVYFINWEIQ